MVAWVLEGVGEGVRAGRMAQVGRLIPGRIVVGSMGMVQVWFRFSHPNLYP